MSEKIKTKECSDCPGIKDISEFYSYSRGSKTYYLKRCKSCHNKLCKKNDKKFYTIEENRIKRNENDKKRYEENKDSFKQRSKEYESRPEVKERRKNYRKENKELYNNFREQNKPKRNAQEKQKRIEDPSITINLSISSMIRKAIKTEGGSKNGESFWNYIGYTKEQLMQHIENLFQPWMNWQNLGIYDPSKWNDESESTWRWQLDHILPKSLFKYSSMNDEEFRKCWALSNLRPLSAKQNVIDGASKIRHKIEVK